MKERKYDYSFHVRRNTIENPLYSAWRLYLPGKKKHIWKFLKKEKLAQVPCRYNGAFCL